MNSSRFPSMTRLPRALARAVLACATVGAFALGVAGPSQAATTQTLGTVGGLKYVRADGTLPQTVGTRTGDFVQAYCGSVWTATGAGVAVGGDPSVSFLSATDVGKYGVYGGGWHALQPDQKLSVYGICAKTATVTADTRYANFPTPPSSVGFTTGCAAGHVLGGGVEGPYLDSHVGASMPVDGPDADKVPGDGWRGSSAALSGSSPIMLIHYVCGTGPTPKYRSTKTQVLPGEKGTLKVGCRNSQHVTGGGALVSGPVSDGHTSASRPIDGPDADHIPDDGWLATVSNDSGSAETAKVTAICVG
jgi:hypothetical protein